MNHKDKLLYNYLVDRGIGFVVICVVIYCIIELICSYPDPLKVTMNITDPYLSMFIVCCLVFGFIEITSRIIACVIFLIYKLVTFIIKS